MPKPKEKEASPKAREREKEARERKETAKEKESPARRDSARKETSKDKEERAERREARSAAREKPAPVQYKAPYDARELVEWRKLLIQKRMEISSDIAGLYKDAIEAEDGHTTPNHIAERGSDADLQDMSLGMAGEEENILWQIDRALRKIDKADPLPFGLCEYSKDPIPKSRLQLIPWTPLSIEGATHMEENHLTIEDMLVDE